MAISEKQTIPLFLMCRKNLLCVFNWDIEEKHMFKILSDIVRLSARHITGM